MNYERGLPLPKSNLSLMHIAAFADSLDVFIYLNKNQGLKIRHESAAGYYPLHYACLNGSYEVASYILSVDPEEAKLELEIPYHCIYLSTLSGDSDILTLVLDNGADASSPTNRKEASIEHAMRAKNSKCLKILLNNGSKFTMDGSKSAIMVAISNYHQDAVPLLVDSGENPDYVSPDFQTALTLACFQSFPETVKYLCSKMNHIDIHPSLREKALVHWICSSKNPQIVRTVLEKDINVNRLDRDGYPGPHYLVDLTSEPVAIDILTQLCDHGLDLNIKCTSVEGKEQNSILADFILGIKKPYKVIQWLLENGADPEAKIPTQNKTIKTYVMNSRDNRLKRIFKDFLNGPKPSNS